MNTFCHGSKCFRQRCQRFVLLIGAIDICYIVVIINVVVLNQIAVDVLCLFCIQHDRLFAHHDSLTDKVFLMPCTSLYNSNVQDILTLPKSQIHFSLTVLDHIHNRPFPFKNVLWAMTASTDVL